MHLRPLAPVVLLALMAAALPAKEPITETDLLKIQRVTELRASTDGSVAVYVVQSIHTEPPVAPSTDPTYSYRTHIWMCDLRNPAAKPVQLTSGERNDASIELSPDGTQIAFIRIDPKKEKPKPQVWLLSLRSPGEARMVTSLEYGAEKPRWRKDGKALLVTSPIPISKLPGKPSFDLERPGREWWDFDRVQPGSTAKIDARPDGGLRSIRNWLEHNSDHNDPADLTRIAFLDEMSLSGELTLTQLFRVDLDGEPKVAQLTSSFNDHDQAAFSPQGDQILFVSRPETHLHPDRVERSVIWQMNANGSNERPLLGDEKYSFLAPEFTPEGKHLVVTGVQNDRPTYRQAMLAAADPDGSHLSWLTKDGDDAVESPRVTSDGHVYYTVNYHGGQPLRRVDIATHQIETLIDGPVGINTFSLAGNQVAYSQIGIPDPNELYVGLTHPRRLTDLNTGWLATKTIAAAEEHWTKRPDGTSVEYWVMKPAHADPAKKYPWVLDMHGGPAAMWGPGEFTMWHEFQILCSFGYGVVYANPRGSSGYGYDFQRANYKDWGEGPMGDVMAALDEATANDPMIDKDRLFVTGGSYAGYLTAWIVGHTSRFKAAAALRGVYDLSTFFGEGNAYRLVPEEFGGFPWEPETRRLLDRESPIGYVNDIKTPLLIIHGSQDYRTGVTQGQMLFRALKQLNRPVEYVRYPGVGHELTRSGPPQQRMDHMLRIIEFFERYSANERSAPESQPKEIQSSSVSEGSPGVKEP